MSIQDNKTLYLATVALFVLLWSSAFALGKLALSYAPAQLFLGFRFLVAGLLLIGFAAAIGALPKLSWSQIGILALLGLLNQAGYQGLAWVAMEEISSGLVAVMISMNPIFISVLAVPLLGERLTLPRATGLGLGILGVIIVLNNRITVSGEDVGGILLTAIALGSVVLGTITFKKYALNLPISVAVGGQFISAGLILLSVGLATEDVASIQINADSLILLLYFIFGVNIGGVGLWFYLLSKGSASEASALHFLMPPFGLFFGWLILREQAALGDFLGIIPIAFGIWLTSLKKLPKLSFERLSRAHMP